IQFDNLRIFDNVFVFPDGKVAGVDPKPYLSASGSPPGAVLDTPNVTRRESEIAELCFADEAARDYRIACESSPALDGTGTPPSEIPGLASSVLPLGVYTDLAGRTYTDPTNYGAFQTVIP